MIAHSSAVSLRLALRASLGQYTGAIQDSWAPSQDREDPSMRGDAFVVGEKAGPPGTPTVLFYASYGTVDESKSPRPSPKSREVSEKESKRKREREMNRESRWRRRWARWEEI